MKIFAVIHNYGAPSTGDLMGCGEAGWYEMPDSSILRSGNPFFIPDSDSEYRVFPSLCLRIGRLGKNVAERFAHRYPDAWTMGAAVVAATRLQALREASMPWAAAVAFDRSCLIGNLQPIDTLKEYGTFEIEHAGSKISYEPAKLIRSCYSIISAVTADNTIKTGDLILAGLDTRGITLCENASLTIRTNDYNLLEINIK